MALSPPSATNQGAYPNFYLFFSFSNSHLNLSKSLGVHHTLYGSYVNLFNGKWNVAYTSHCRVVGMPLYRQGWWRPKWKDLKTSNVETQGQVNVHGMGIKVWIEWIRCLIGTLMTIETSISKFMPIGGTWYFRWGLKVCWKNGGRLGGMIKANCRDHESGKGKMF